MSRTPAEGLQHDHVERALKELDAGERHGLERDREGRGCRATTPSWVYDVYTHRSGQADCHPVERAREKEIPRFARDDISSASAFGTRIPQSDAAFTACGNETVVATVDGRS